MFTFNFPQLPSGNGLPVLRYIPRNGQRQRPGFCAGVVRHMNRLAEIPPFPCFERNLDHLFLATPERLLRISGFRTLAVRRGREDNHGSGICTNLEPGSGSSAKLHSAKVVLNAVGRKARNIIRGGGTPQRQHEQQGKKYKAQFYHLSFKVANLAEAGPLIHNQLSCTPCSSSKKRPRPSKRSRQSRSPKSSARNPPPSGRNALR